MARLPAVSDRFYPSNPGELTALIRQYTTADKNHAAITARACLVPHAGYVYSGHVAGAGYARIAIPKKILLLRVRHYPHGANAPILSSGAWRTPLGEAPGHEPPAAGRVAALPLL